MDMRDIKREVDLVVEGYSRTENNTAFMDAMKPALPALIRGQPSAYMSAVHLVGLASEIVMDLYDKEDFLDFGKFLEKSADSVKRCALSGMVTNENTSPRSND